MTIKTQAGETVVVSNIELSHCTIKCTPIQDRRRRIVCGKYENRKRVTEIYKELISDDRKTLYIMPEE